jgi:hypothetical protein
VVGDKLLASVVRTERDPLFAFSLPDFAAGVNQLFTTAELGEYLDRLHRDLLHLPPKDRAEELRRYAYVRELLEC